MLNIVFILEALLILCLIVVAHELGHYIAGRAVGIGVEEFAVGFGPKILGFTRKGIKYSLRLIPLGGYCKFVGEDADDTAPDAMNNQKVWKRFVTILSGPVMNGVLAFAAVVVALTVLGTPKTMPRVGELTPDMPAERVGMLPGDIITGVNGEAVEYSPEGAMEMRRLIQASKPQEGITITVDRAGEPVNFSLTPQEMEGGNYGIGIIMGTDREKYPFFQSLRLSGEMIGDFSRMMLDSIKNLFFRGEGLEETMGPVGIINFMSQEVRNGFDSILYLIVVISLNLGIMNLLPLPALDGGRLIFLIVEGIRRKPVKPEYEGWVHAAGFLLLIGLVIIITYRDILRIIGGG